MRKCNLCDWKSKADDPRQALGEFAEHSAGHNPSPAQWTTAYNMIQAAKAKVKRSE